MRLSRPPFNFISITHYILGDNLTNDIISRLNAEGFPITEFIPDAQFHRFAIDKTDHRKSGFYLGFMNHRVTTGEPYFFVIYGSWRDGIENARRYSTLSGDLTAVESKLQKEQIKKAQKQAEKFKNEAHLLAADEAQKKWDKLSCNLTGEHDYLVRKQINGLELGLKFDNFYGDIYVPARDENGKLWSFEKIDRNGNKLSHSGGRKSGCFHVIGEGNRIYFAEGLATAASIQLATGSKVVCTFGAANLKPVAIAFRRLFPDGKFVICGDCDKRDSDASRIAAEDAGKAATCAVVFPRFETLVNNAKDFNDLHCLEGIDVVKRQLVPENLPKIQYSVTESVFPDETPDGKRIGTLENVKSLLKGLNVTVRYNVIKKCEIISVPNLTTSIDNELSVKRTWISDHCKRAKVPSEDLKFHLCALADQNIYNPVISWIETEPWDGRSRLEEFYETIQSPEKKLKKILMLKWLISAVAALYEPNGVYAGGVLVLQGKQYSGKTAWFKKLAPYELDVLAEGVTLRPDDKDSVYHAISHWIVELGELDATFRKADIAQLKSFLVKMKDSIRRPYAEVESNFVRRTVFFASVNEKEFLNDPTGNRRFWTIPCDSIDYAHSINMQQLWAEVADLYKCGQDWKLSKSEDEMLNEHNQQFEAIDHVEDSILTKFDWTDKACNELTASEICDAIELQRTQINTRAVARAIRKITGKNVIRKNGKNLFEVPRTIIKKPDFKYVIKKNDE